MDLDDIDFLSSILDQAPPRWWKKITDDGTRPFPLVWERVRVGINPVHW